MAEDIWVARAAAGLSPGPRRAETYAPAGGAGAASGYDSVRDLWLRTACRRRAGKMGSRRFASLGLTRPRGAVGGGDLTAPATRTICRCCAPRLRAAEPDARLPPMPPGEEVIEDYRALSLSLKGHPVAFLRAGSRLRNLALRGLARSRGVLPSRVTVAGLVLMRQRPATAKASSS